MPDTAAPDRRQARVERRLRFMLRAHAFFNPDNREAIRWALDDPDAIPAAMAELASKHFAGPDGAIDWDAVWAALLKWLPIILELLLMFFAESEKETA